MNIDIITLEYPLTHPNGVEGGTDKQVKKAYGFDDVSTEKDENGIKWRTIVGKREDVKLFCEDYCLLGGLSPDSDIDDEDETYYFINLD